jgi:hypothetical protein
MAMYRRNQQQCDTETRTVSDCGPLSSPKRAPPPPALSPSNPAKNSSRLNRVR